MFIEEAEVEVDNNDEKEEEEFFTFPWVCTRNYLQFLFLSFFPLILFQDRCHRIGQTKPVTVYRLVCSGTVDESILRLATKKQQLEGMVMSETPEVRRIK